MKKVVLLAFVLVLLSTALVVGVVRPVADSLPFHNIDSGKVIAQTDSAATVYLDPPTINATAIGENFTVNLNIRDAPAHSGWQAGLTFNASVLECTGFYEGEFLSDEGATFWVGDPGYINNTSGDIIAHGCSLLFEDVTAEGDGRLAYLNFTAKAPGISDLHLRDVMLSHWVWVEPPGVWEPVDIPTNIIDVYTIVVDTTPHTVVTLSNSTGSEAEYGSGFYGHAFSIPAEKISFWITSPYPGFSNVTIPKTLLNVSTLDEWRVAMDGILISTGERIITENATHYSIYFTYSAGIHYVQITTRPLITSIISVTLSSNIIGLGSNLTISGDIDPVRLGVIVTILHRCKVYEMFRRWTTLATVTTDEYSSYSYKWTPDEIGTYEFMAMWEGDDNTFGDVSDVKNMTVLEAPPPPSARTTVYLDPPTINATAIGENFTVNIKIRDASPFNAWQAGLTFNASILNCTGFYEGEFLSDEGPTIWVGEPEWINNTLGDIEAHGCSLLLEETAEGDGRLAYLNFTAKAPGISDLHLRDVKLYDWIEVKPDVWELVMIPCNIIDVYTVAPHSVVTVSNSTGSEPGYRSGFSDHAFNASLEEISFKVTSPYPGFSNVTIPKALLRADPPRVWTVITDALNQSRTVIENATHTSIYFTYPPGIHQVRITTRPLIASTISIALSSTSITVGSNVTISGAIDPVRVNVPVIIRYRTDGGTWATLTTVTTDQNGNYSYTWTPDETGTYQVKASWEGDNNTLGDESDVQPLTVWPIIIRADGSVDPPTAPISSVDNVTYTFTAGINKSIVVERDNIVVDGNGYILQGTEAWPYKGISLSGRSNVTIKNMEIKAFRYGIHLFYSSNNTISGNNITNSGYGIFLHTSSSNTISGNNITNNNYGIYLDNSSNNSICGNSVTENNKNGIYLWHSSSNSIYGNNITANNEYGIWLYKSSNNSIPGNNITYNLCGVVLDSSSNNKFYHNNFINYIQQVYVYTSGYANYWDDGYPSGGNYWSDYNGTDFNSGPYQNETDSDGIGDTPYIIEENNQDRYPLITTTIFRVGLSTRFGVVWEEETYYVDVISNSTVEKFRFKQSGKLITFNVTGPPGTTGYCNVTIPKDLLKGEPWIVLVDGSPPTPGPIITPNTTHTSLYFTYSHSKKTVEITGTGAIPEFPTWTPMLLILVVLTVAIATYKRRLRKTPIH